jgi:hypothetical protein
MRKQSKRQFHKTVIKVIVLSEEPYDNTDVDQLAHDIRDGDCSGEVRIVSSKVLTGRQAAKALQAQGSDPDFFRLTEDGKDTADEGDDE